MYDVTGQFKIIETVTNSSSTAATVNFGFHIVPGYLQNSIYSPLTGSQFVSSGISFDIQTNLGGSVFSSSATLASNAGGTTFAQTGTNLYAGSGTYYAINGTTQNVSLGTLNAGQSLTLTYTLDTFAKGNALAGPGAFIPAQTLVVPDQWVCKRDGGAVPNQACPPVFVPGQIVTIPGYFSPGQPGGSHASSGDPFSFDSSGQALFFDSAELPPGVEGFSFTLTPVPEPETYGLMLAGLAAVAGTTRRRRRA